MIFNRLKAFNVNNTIRRLYSSSRKLNSQESIRNIGILAHIDAGMIEIFKKINKINIVFLRQDNYNRANALLCWQDKDIR